MKKNYRPLRELLLFRYRSFIREPEAVFWTYGFPLVLTVALGVAFRDQPPAQVYVDLVAGPAAGALRRTLAPDGGDHGFTVQVNEPAECADRLRLGKCQVVVSRGALPAEVYTYRFDPSRPESVSARARVDDALQRASGRTDPVSVSDAEVTEPGSRYIDFLIPGLLGMNLMAGGMWGIGYVTVDLRVRKLLKLLIATPMRRSYFLLSMVGGRMGFVFPELVVILLAGVLLFELPIKGSLLAVLVVSGCGALCFAGLGLLVASRAQRLETAAGLLNLVMMPMWLLSGLFFSTDHFPDQLQPVIQLLPLTQLINTLRAVILEGSGLGSELGPLLYLLAWGLVSFYLALRWFRWT